MPLLQDDSEKLLYIIISTWGFFLQGEQLFKYSDLFELKYRQNNHRRKDIVLNTLYFYVKFL